MQSHSRPPDQFIQEEWIGVGKKYDIATLPDYVTEAKAALLAIPGQFLAASLPKDDLSVANFLAQRYTM